MIKVGVHGASGHMGRLVCEAVSRAEGLELTCAFARKEAGIEPRFRDAFASDLERVGDCDVIIDFSRPEGIPALLDACVRFGIPLLIATTGYNDEIKERIFDAAGNLPILLAPNTSLGVAVLSHLVREATKLLPEFEIEIEETHHRRKIDAPSGTAKHLFETVKEERPTIHSNETKSTRELDYVPIHAFRGGDVVGDHAVHFFGSAERITLTHRADSRALFAHGAVFGAKWIAEQSAPGLYSMRDVFADAVRLG